METQKENAFNVIGIAVRTTNEDGKSSKDIPELWTRFMSENIPAQITGKLDECIYCLYTEYEKDHTRPYTTILGCRVDSIQEIPDGLVGRTVEEGMYNRFVAKGNLMEGAVFNEWLKIWNSDIDRAFTTDYEVYGEASQDPVNGEADIFVAVK
ncbi:GyrI-like domain-containing protein [Desertivirga xinjiangensis]|uniref:GyrI-like domain-containing protein n=1 Tax=Desertivirga xinjiangensis TaxID=539206 RepID=UPI00210DA3A0|nr:GyrI-like domain-containing protein [Pedobacter xinjiangensis]